MKHSTKKKKRSRPANQVVVQRTAREEEDSEERGVLKSLMEAFTSVSLEEAASAYRESKGDPNKAAEILASSMEIAEDNATSCSSSSGSVGTSSSSGSAYMEAFMEAHGDINGVHGRGLKGTRQKKKFVASTGTVSTVLGKGYVMSSPRKDSFKENGHMKVHPSKEEAEQFLCSMLGDDCELSMAVVRDVLCQCGFNIEKALNSLLELSASPYELLRNSQSCEQTVDKKEDVQFLLECNDSSTDRTSDSTSHTSESELHDVWSTGFPYRNYSEVLTGPEINSRAGPRTSESELPQLVLESLFNMPKSSEHEPNSMNWRDVAKKMISLGQRSESEPADAVDLEQANDKGDDYHVCRKAANQHWDSMKSYYQKAAAAFSNGERSYAACLSKQGRICYKLAQEADKKASLEIFKARNKSIENVITIDLHGQHVKQAMRLLKVHLLFGAYACSVQNFRVITGCGSHGAGKSKLKQSVINLVESEGIEWKEENRGTVLIKLGGQREFSFLESGSDSE
ncbi:hypothetical protein NMG60_11014489 [Bertholletia excelsa]